MARARNIKPGFFRNADLVELPFEARLLFIGLWTIADRSGRLEDRHRQVKMELFPADNVDCDALLGQLAEAGFIVRYEAAGKKVVQIVNFSKHQNPHRDEKASTLPDMGGNLQAPNKHGAGTVQAPCKDDADTVAIGLNPDSRILIPEINTEPSGSVGSADTLPRCDAQFVIDTYHASLPELPAVRLLSDTRRRAISKFWKFALTSKRLDGTRRATDAVEAAAWVRSYFDRVRDNDFLMGRGPKAPGHAGWQCDLDFLLSERGLKQVIEKTGEAT